MVPELRPTQGPGALPYEDEYGRAPQPFLGARFSASSALVEPTSGGSAGPCLCVEGVPAPGLPLDLPLPISLPGGTGALSPLAVGLAMHTNAEGS